MQEQNLTGFFFSLYLNMIFIFCTYSVMTRKEYLLKVLSFLEKDRPVATGLKILIQEDALDTETLDTIQKILDDAIAKTKDQKEKNRLLKIRSHLDTLQQREQEERAMEEQDLLNLESELENL